jgi:prepilin-type N-terminal cleavage/methylation domain-containing protein
MSRRGFTLVEVIVALVVTSTVLLVGYTALAASIDTRDRLRVQQDRGDRQLRTESLLRDALRHLVDAEQLDVPPLRLVRATRNGRDADSLIVISRGVDPLLGAGRLWRVTVTADELGAVISAVPLLRADEPPTQLPPPLASRLDQFAGVRIEVLERVGALAWRTDWPQPVSVPAAVSLTFVPRDSTTSAVPLIVRLGPPGSV